MFRFDTNVEVGDIIHIVDIDDPALLSSSNSTNSNNNGIVKSSSDQEIVIVINKLSGIIVVCPDIMISPTKIAEACSCVRRGVLSDRIRSLGMSAPSAILGNVRHSFIEKLSERVLGILLQYPQQDVKGKYQKALMERYVVSQLPQQEMDMMIEKCVQPFIEELYCMQANDDFIRKELYNMIAPVVEWMTLATLHSTMQLVQQNAAHESMQYPPTSSSSNTSTNSSTWKKKISDLKMRDIVGIEESIVSPVVGIKGQLDMISAGSTYPNPQGTGLVMLPIEFKTGKWRPSTSIAHRAQVILYILLMMLRQRSPAHSLFQHSHQSQEEEEVAYYGVILYLNESEVKVDYISPQWYEMIALIRSRNQLAKHIHQCNQAVVLAQKKSNPTTSDSAEESIILTAYSNNLQAIPNRLPPVLQSINECSFCYSAAECMMYHAAIEDGTEATSGVSALYHYVLRGLTSRHVKYLRYWDRLIDLEAMSSKDVAPFAQYGFEREGMRSSNSNSNSSGGNGVRCLSGLIMDSNAINSNNIANAKNEKVDIIFRRSKKYLEKFTVSDSTNGISKIAFVDLDCSGFMVGDRVMLSIEYLKDINLGMAGYTSIGHEALTNIYANLCSGSITSIGSDFMEVSVAMGARSIIK